jgi:hypothetical protein
MCLRRRRIRTHVRFFGILRGISGLVTAREARFCATAATMCGLYAAFVEVVTCARGVIRMSTEQLLEVIAGFQEA